MYEMPCIHILNWSVFWIHTCKKWSKITHAHIYIYTIVHTRFERFYSCFVKDMDVPDSSLSIENKSMGCHASPIKTKRIKRINVFFLVSFLEIHKNPKTEMFWAVLVVLDIGSSSLVKYELMGRASTNQEMSEWKGLHWRSPWTRQLN